MKRKPDILVAIRLLLPTALLVSAVASCATTRMVRVEQLQRLDGYEAGQVSQPTQQVETLDGEPERLDSGANLYLGVTGRWVGGRFESIRVRDGRFEGRTAEGLAIEAPMDQITAAKISRPEYLKSFLAISGVLLGLLVIAGAVSISAFEAQGGRALRIRGKSVAAPLVISGGWRTPDIGPDVSSLSPEAREALAAAWASSARSEHASVPAFSRLSLSLVSLGAPAHLVQAALRAALEEIEHARLSFALAEAYGLTPVGPGPLVELTSAPAVTVTSRADLVCESLIDGCLLEGAAAAYVQVAHARAMDPAVRAALAIIARDEASHAELAWEIVRWGCRGVPVDLRRRLLVLVRDQRAPKAPVDVPTRLSSVLEAHGWPDAAVWHDLFKQTRAEVISRMERDEPSARPPSQQGAMLMMRSVALLVVSLSVVPALGCGGGDGGDGGDVPFNHLAAEYGAAFCHKNFVCCDPTETGVAEADITTAEALCRTNLANEWAPFLAPYAPLIAQGRIIYHGDRARLCFDEIAAKPCAESGNSGDLRLYPDCLQIYEGTIAIGGACTLSEECADGVCSSTGVCEAQRQIGDACVGDACPSGLACVRDSSGASSVCGTPLPDGATCSHYHECASRFCEASVCGPPTMCNGV